MASERNGDAILALPHKPFLPRRPIAVSPVRPFAGSPLTPGTPADQRAAQRSDLFVEISRTGDSSRDFVA
jgi:hypothetical protein